MEYGPTAATRRWNETAEQEHLQAERLRDALPETDPWQGRTRRFAPARGGGERDEDPTVALLYEYVKPEHVALDIGAGAGRLTIPLAKRCRRVVAVERSEAMLEALKAQISAHGVENVAIVPEPWETARVEAVDVSLCAHVLYDVRPVEDFVAKMARCTRRRILVILFEAPAQVNYYPLWRAVHGEDRIPLPALGEFQAVLDSWGVEYETRHLPVMAAHGFPDFETALAESARRLYVDPRGPASKKLESALREALEETADGLRFKWAAPARPALVTWETGAAGPEDGR